MNDLKLNRFCSSLRRLCAVQPLTEKWLVAPSVRVGLKWVDAVAGSGQPVANLQLVTISRLARDLARPIIEKHNLRFVTQSIEEVSLGRILTGLCQEKQGYLSQLQPSISLVRALCRSVRELRMSELTPGQLDLNAFEVHTKGQELRWIAQEYDQQLEKQRLVDDAKALRLAAELVRQDPSSLPPGLMVITPQDLVFHGLEQTFWRSFPKSILKILPVDLPPTDSAATPTKASIPGWIAAPSEVSGCLALGSLQIFRALGEASEIREVLRRCIESGLSTDQVEILHTDFQTYVPLIHQLTAVESIPVSFSEGVPARTFRPGRALLTWLQWIRQGFTEQIHHQMQLEKLLQEGVELKKLHLDPLANPSTILFRAIEFLRHRARSASKLDEYCRQRLIQRIQELYQCLEEAEQPKWLDAWSWLTELPHTVRVGGEGPRPGHLYVTHLEAGGHSGRSHTFIVGLDDSRFPGSGLQDPLLLDQERKKLSGQLNTSRQQISSKLKEFHRLLARLQGQVCLSYPCRDLRDERDLFSSQPIQSARKYLHTEREADTRARPEHMDATYGFATDKSQKCLNHTDWWLWRLGARLPPEDPIPLVLEAYTHLKRGYHARASRESNEFTEYDGYVPEAGKRLNPSESSGVVLSAGQLETMGQCPMEFFFRYVLEVELPPIYRKKPWAWLDPMTRGSLLHQVFCDFLTCLKQEGKSPQLERDWEQLQNILHKHLKNIESKISPASPHMFEQELNQFESIACIFLRDQEASCTDSLPSWLEVSVGIDRLSAKTMLDSAEPISLPLPSGKNIRVSAMIDRVDRDREDPLCFSVIDYKTGTAWKYRQDPPFNQGRIVQNALYPFLVQTLLHKKISPKARVKSFGYYFPSTNECGLRISWNAEEMTKGLEYIDLLCRLIATGCFPFTDQPKDVTFSDYLPAYGDVTTCAQQARFKLANPDNQELHPFRILRGTSGIG